MGSLQSSQSLQQIIGTESVRKRFEDMLGNGAASFISSILTVTNSNERLKQCTPASILSAAAMAAALRLPINPALGLAHIIPFKSGSHYVATFSLGAKGYIQLAMRSSQYKTVNAGPVCEGQVKDIDFLTGEIIRGEKISDKVVGYCAYFELLNGFTKSLYMTNEELLEHAKKYSISYQNDLKYNKKTSLWTNNFKSMATKTVLKLLLSKYGIMEIDARSTDLVRGLAADQAAISHDGIMTYVDNHSGTSSITGFSEVIGNLEEFEYQDESENTEDVEEMQYPTDEQTSEDNKN